MRRMRCDDRSMGMGHMNIAMQCVDSLSELRERLRSLPRVVMLGDKDESLRDFFLCELPGLTLGICSQGLGIQPVVWLDPTEVQAWVGLDCSVARINIAQGCVSFVHHLPCVFFTFLCHLEDGSSIVLHELGAVRLRNTGEPAWSVDIPDILTEFHDRSTQIELTDWNGEKHWVNKETGEVSGA